MQNNLIFSEEQCPYVRMFSNQEQADMIFLYGFCNGKVQAAVRERRVLLENIQGILIGNCTDILRLKLSLIVFNDFK